MNYAEALAASNDREKRRQADEWMTYAGKPTVTEQFREFSRKAITGTGVTRPTVKECQRELGTLMNEARFIALDYAQMVLDRAQAGTMDPAEANAAARKALVFANYVEANLD